MGGARPHVGPDVEPIHKYFNTHKRACSPGLYLCQDILLSQTGPLLRECSTPIDPSRLAGLWQVDSWKLFIEGRIFL